MHPRGFSLLEVMIGLAVIVMATTLVIPTLRDKSREQKQTLRRVVLGVENTMNKARLFNKTYRFVFNLTGPDSKEPDSFWVEKASQRVPFGESFNEVKPEGVEGSDENKQKKPSIFSLDPKVFKKPQTLKDLKILQLEIDGFDRPITQGRAYIYFLPEGIAQEAVVQFQLNKETTWSVVVRSLAGRAHVLGKPMTLKEWQVK